MLSKRFTDSLPRLRDDFFLPIQQEFDKLLNNWFGESQGMVIHGGYPKMDIHIQDGKFKVVAAVPGVSPDNLKVEIIPVNGGRTSFTDDWYGRILRISGEMAGEYRSSQTEKTAYFVRELHKSRFSREMTLPTDLTGDPEAQVKDGILTLTWDYAPKEEDKEKPKSIEIKRG